MGRVTALYLGLDSGRFPVRDFVDSLDPRTQRKFFFVKSLLEEFGHLLPAPHAKYIGDGIFELRFWGPEGGVRVLYFFFHQDRAILTNGFVKKTVKTPPHEKELAVRRRAEYLRAQTL